MRLISYLKNPIDHSSSGEREYITVQGIGKLKAAFKGVLTFYAWIEGVPEVAFPETTSLCRRLVRWNILTTRADLSSSKLNSVFHAQAS
jgi:hypothetical protein